MNKLRSKEWLIPNLVMSVRMSVLMSIFIPLLNGVPIILSGFLLFGLIGFFIGMIIGFSVPLKRIAVAVNRLVTKKEAPALQNLIISALNTTIISGIIQIIQGLTAKED